MKTIYFVCAALVLLLSVPCVGADTRLVGNLWNELDETARIFYVAGVIEGTSIGELWSTPILEGPPQPTDEQLRVAEEHVTSVYRSFTERHKRYLGGRVNNKQIADGLTSFFKDFRNRSILLIDSIQVVLRQIAGENTDELVQQLRAKAAKP